MHAETAASLAARLQRGGALICEKDGLAAGCLFYAASTPDHLEVGRLAVLPEHRRQGLGELLLRAAERRAAELGLPRVRLGVRVSLAGLRAYYEARGYLAVALRSHEGYTDATYVEMEKTVQVSTPR